MNKIALVVDDTSYIREDIKDILEEQGYKVYEASDGLEAVEMYKKVNPSVVTMDINMPRMHGLKAAQVITDLDKEARIMICSTMVMFPNYMKMGKEAGAKAFLVIVYPPIAESIRKKGRMINDIWITVSIALDWPIFGITPLIQTFP